MAFSNSASPETIRGLGGPEEDHQLHHCCWTGRVSEREEEEEEVPQYDSLVLILKQICQLFSLYQMTNYIPYYLE